MLAQKVAIHKMLVLKIQVGSTGNAQEQAELLAAKSVNVVKGH